MSRPCFVIPSAPHPVPDFVGNRVRGTPHTFIQSNRERLPLTMPAFDWDAVIAGAGAAGLMAAIRAAERGRRVLLLEKGKKPGVKILMSGGTRCEAILHSPSAI